MRKLAVVTIFMILACALAAVPTFAQGQDVSCPGSLLPRLTVGARGEIAQVFSTLRYTPGGIPIQIVYAPAQFIVLEGPACAGNLNFYRIQYDNGWTGWANESELTSFYGFNQYWLQPAGDTLPPPPPPPVPTNCVGEPAPRLTVGARGQIAQYFSTLRDIPGGAPLQIVYAPAQFTVLEGPVCDGWLYYYRIQYDDGSTGWANESQAVSFYGLNQYWLEPVSAG